VSKRAVTFQVALRMDFDDGQMQALQAAADRHGVFLGVPASPDVEVAGNPLDQLWPEKAGARPVVGRGRAGVCCVLCASWRAFASFHPVTYECMSLKRRMKRAVEKRLDRGEIALVNGYEVSYKPVHPAWYSRLPSAGREAIVRLNAAVNQDEPDDATLQELEHLIETYPFAPVFYNYLAIAYSRRGMHELADQTIDRVLQRVPDYLFARLNRAENLLWSGDDAQVLSLLGPTLELRDLCPGRTRYHVSEFAGYYAVVGMFESRRGNLSRAAGILAMLQAVAPGERATDALADELQSPRLLRRLARFVPEMKPKDGGVT
jgi:hypothetical protein